MARQYGIKFAVHLITNHFGNLVAKVCECLLRRGTLTLEQLVRFTELTKEQVKNSLLVLVQHNCVQAFILEQEGSKAYTQYLVLFDNILHRLRFPKFLEVVSQDLDEECVELLEGLLRDGRLTLKQMVDRASQRKENAVALDVVQESLRKLLMVRYVERCPSPEPVISPPVEQDTKRRGAKSKIVEEPETIEYRVLEAAVPVEGIRFSLTSNSDVINNSEISPTTGAGANVAREDSTLFRANFEEFIRRCRHKVLIENVRTSHDDEPATVLGAILDATRNAEKKVKMENSVPLTLDAIFTEVQKTASGRAMTMERVRSSLVLLGCPQRMLDDSYSIDLKKIIESARDEEVESIVLKRYGRDAYRMFRLLSKAGRFLETDKIAESTFVEKRDTPKILYKLWKDDYLHMEKLVVTGARQSKFLLWKVNKPILWEHVLDEMHHAALNLSLRLAYEQEKDEELLNVPRDKIVGPLQKRYKRLRNAWLLLESSLMKLDDALMLFHDF
ncbi:DNA-directed RNA polymerase III subunit RPC3 isoform X1 [Neltuma alba]|uniref:DNA-directed RNA polymerase III subunit RPC3 isoform X1 n=1 Tax=Neltuma alba TaxID=207710 RepID=UPI0010A39E7F|nr:DNA-directed RNA polymerase III subunit RPC3 isoform X1 [Prosopis alba]